MEGMAVAHTTTCQKTTDLCTWKGAEIQGFFIIWSLKAQNFKLEFGKNSGKIYLGDEFTPDGCRVWDKETKKKLDKDRFRLGLGDVVESYQEIAHRLGVNLT